MLDTLETKVVLEKDGRRIPVTATFASKYSIWIKFLQEYDFSCKDNFSLILRKNGESFRISPCKILPSPSSDADTFRLVFQKDVYDTHDYLLEKFFLKQQAAFTDLPQIIARKNLVKKPFKEFVANLRYDLHVYKNLFDELDNQLISETVNTRQVLQEALIKTEGHKFRNFFHSKVQELDCIVSNYSREEHQLHGLYFRNQLMSFILCCPLMARTNVKPRGYAGDSKMMQMIYLNNYQGKSTFSKLMQKYTVGTSAAQSVRNRQTVILECVDKIRDRLKLPMREKIRILSVACGPAWELKKIFKTKIDFNKFHFTLLDQDQKALNEARQMIDYIESNSGESVKVDYVKASARTMIANKAFKNDIGKFHLIYSMGLFDYLSKPVAMRVMDRIYNLLIPQGELVVGNFHVLNSSRNFMEYWGDWYLIHRTQNELLSLLNDKKSADISIMFEDSKNQMFLKANKRFEN